LRDLIPDRHAATKKPATFMRRGLLARSGDTDRVTQSANLEENRRGFGISPAVAKSNNEHVHRAMRLAELGQGEKPEASGDEAG
jgi:hypothetical protein